MTWKTLRDALEMAAACGFDVDGEDATAIASLRPEKARAEAPASSQEIPPVVIRDTSRCMTTALPNGLPRPAVVIHLVVDNEGGRSPAGRSDEAPAFRVSPRRKARELGMYVVG